MTIESTIKRNAYWFNDKRRGGFVRSGFKDLQTVMGNYSKGSAIQKQRLKSMLTYAAENTAFYSEYKDKVGNLSEWPILTKLDLIEHFEEHCVPEGKIPGQNGRPVYIQKTGGSTGVPFSVPQDYLKRQRRISEIKYFNELDGFKSHERLCHCRVWTQWQKKSKWQTFKENIYAFNVENMGDETIDELVELISSKRIEVLRGYASWHRTLAEAILEGKVDKAKLESLKLIISESDALDERTREIFEEQLHCPIIDSYGNEENGTFGYQTIGSTNFVMNHAGYIFEVLDFESDKPVKRGEIGRLVVTDLFNHAFPMIRYDTGDACIFDGAEDEWPTMSLLMGRKLDIIFDSEGNPIQPMAFSRILKNFPEIKQWQFIQTGEFAYTLKASLRSTDNNDEIMRQLRRIVGEAGVVSIEQVEEIPVLRSGKRKPVVQEWKR